MDIPRPFIVFAAVAVVYYFYKKGSGANRSGPFVPYDFGRGFPPGANGGRGFLNAGAPHLMNLPWLRRSTQLVGRADAPEIQ